MPHRIARAHYADIFGPTTGDTMQLGDTGLVVQIGARLPCTAMDVNLAAARVLPRRYGPSHRRVRMPMHWTA